MIFSKNLKLVKVFQCFKTCLSQLLILHMYSKNYFIAFYTYQLMSKEKFYNFVKTNFLVFFTYAIVSIRPRCLVQIYFRIKNYSINICFIYEYKQPYFILLSYVYYYKEAKLNGFVLNQKIFILGYHIHLYIS